VTALADVLVACEAKSVMTEHSKQQPRLFDELASAHDIVHAGSPQAIATGIAVINIAPQFASPLRQEAGKPLHFSIHNQPHVTQRVVDHLRGLPIRDNVAQVGFDAFATLVIDCDNQNPARLWTAPPAPQPGDRDFYGAFVTRVAAFYAQRFRTLP